MKHLEILAYAMNVLNWREFKGKDRAFYTTEDAKKSQVVCSLEKITALILVEDEPVGKILTALDSVIANHWGKAYTPDQFIEARKELLELAGCRDQQTLREVVCPDR